MRKQQGVADRWDGNETTSTHVVHKATTYKTWDTDHNIMAWREQGKSFSFQGIYLLVLGIQYICVWAAKWDAINAHAKSNNSSLPEHLLHLLYSSNSNVH